MIRQVIDVTQADIDGANKYRANIDGKISSGFCPIAMALKRLYPGKNVLANPTHLLVGVYCHPGTLMAVSSQKVQRFMRQWDKTGKAVPARFAVQWE